MCLTQLERYIFESDIQCKISTELLFLCCLAGVSGQSPAAGQHQCEETEGDGGAVSAGGR